MIAGWTAILSSLAYLCALFAVAHWGDNAGQRLFHGPARSALYALGLSIYCTSWTFFGSVGLASTTGYDFIPVYLGPVLVFAFGHRLVARMVRISKTNNITTVADFVSARYGKSESVAALVAGIAVVGIVPYVALQIKAITISLNMVFHAFEAGQAAPVPAVSAWVAIVVAALLAVFTMAFGTRRLEATEHHSGLMLAVGIESIVKLVAFFAVGAFVTWGMFGGPGDLYARAESVPAVRAVFTRWPDPLTWIAITLLSACAILLLPRQFHVSVVENRSEGDIARAATVFPIYLVAINLFVVPLAAAGLILLPGGEAGRDMTVLALPLLPGGSQAVAMLAMIGGFSAAAAMVVVACLALSIMVCNDLVIPLFLHWRALRPQIGTTDITGLILGVRRGAIAALVALSVLYLEVSDDAALAMIGLLSFSAIAQIAPAFLGGLYWRRANARGARAGLIAGIAVWCLLLLLPSFSHNPLAPDESSLTMPVLVQGTLLSLLANILAFAGFSFSRRPTQIEHLQANLFIGESQAPPAAVPRPWQSSVDLAELETIVARYLGRARARQAFAALAASRGPRAAATGQVDIDTLRFAEQTLAAVIGAASSRLVLSLALRRHNYSRTDALEMIDEASATIQHNHKLLQHAIDFAQQGISVFDADFRLVFWNREFCDIFDYPLQLLRPGVGLAELVRFDARRGLFGPGTAEDFVAGRMDLLANSVEPFRLPMGEGRGGSGGVIELRSSRMPDGGLVITYTDVTQQVEAEQALAAINETLEQRVRERTDELVSLNSELGRAKAAADEANLSKTRFLAAASHDILQPLNAARLFATALTERAGSITPRDKSGLGETVTLARNVDASLQAVEDILTALLDMSRLDAGAMKPQVAVFRIDEILSQLQIEYEPLAREKGLRLVFAPSSLAVRSDRRLLRRLLQNLVSNAIKYTNSGSVLVGCRRQRGRLRVEVWDTGLGIPEGKRKAVFREFERLDAGARNSHGLGLGLSIVERLARVLGHKITLRSWLGRGSVFAVEAPAAPMLPVAPGAGAADAAPARHHPLEGFAVVAIDDEPRILEGMTALLEGWGCTVIAAANQNQAEALIAAKRMTPQAILADYHLGADLGTEVITRLRWKFGAGLPAILMTADRTQAVRAEAELKNIVLLNKPIKPAALRALLAQWHVTRAAAE